MNTSTVKLQIPMDSSLRDGLEAKATRLGFSSAQEYIRVWAKAEIEDRTLSFGEDSWGEPSPKAVTRLNKWSTEALRDIKSGKLKAHTSTDSMLSHLDSL